MEPLYQKEPERPYEPPKRDFRAELDAAIVERFGRLPDRRPDARRPLTGKGV